MLKKSQSSSLLIVTAPYLVIIILCYLILFHLLGFNKLDLTLPLVYTGDEIFHAAMIKSILQEGWYNESSFAGAPGKMELYDFPLGGDNLHWILIKILSGFIQKPFLLLNTYFILTFPLISISSYFVLKKIDVRTPVAIVLSILFSFTYFHFLRGTSHLLIGAYFTVPLSVLLIYKIHQRKNYTFTASSYKKLFYRKNLFYLLIIAVIASSGVYYAFFTSLFILFTAFLNLFTTRRLTSLFIPALIILLLVSGLLLNMLPTFLYQAKHGKNHTVGLRLPRESEEHGLKLAQLVMPCSNHRIEEFRRFKDRYDSESYLVAENKGSALGIIGTAGLALILITLFFPNTHKEAENKNILLLKLFGTLAIFAILYAGIGGLGTLFSWLINPSLRSINRISIFICFFSLAGIGLAFNLVWNKISHMPFLIIPILLFILGLGVFDQTIPGNNIFQEHIFKSFCSDKNFFNELEVKTPGIKLFQLPYMTFPENGPVHKMADYEHFKGYVHTNNIKWSYGAIRGRKGDQWYRNISALQPKHLIQAIKAQGFGGIQINRLGYQDNAASLEAELSSLLGIVPLISQDSNLSVFSLNHVKNEIIKEVNFADNGNSGAMIGFGWHFQEKEFRWASDSAELIFPVPEEKMDIHLGMTIAPFLVHDAKITEQRIIFYLNSSKLSDYKLTKEDSIEITLPISMLVHGSYNKLQMTFPDASNPADYNQGPSRRISVAFKKVVFE